MDDETKKLFEALEAKIADLKAEEAFHFEQIKKNFSVAHERMEKQRELSLKIEKLMWSEVQRLQQRSEDHWKLHKSAKEWMDIQDEMLDQHSLDISKLYDVYYHVFPERLKQDVQVQRQLKALKSKPASDTDPDKT